MHPSKNSREYGLGSPEALGRLSARPGGLGSLAEASRLATADGPYTEHGRRHTFRDGTLTLAKPIHIIGFRILGLWVYL